MGGLEAAPILRAEVSISTRCWRRRETWRASALNQGIDMWEMSGYLGLFLASFVAATFLPMQSEVVLVALQLAGNHPLGLLLLVATFGNVLGSVVNWLLGRYIERWQDRRWFPVPADKLHKAQSAYQRYGYWSLLLSWAPLIGDPLTLAAGVMREPFWSFLLLVTLAKGGRYLILVAGTAWFG